jgi:hypothetical protein
LSLNVPFQHSPPLPSLHEFALALARRIPPISSKLVSSISQLAWLEKLAPWSLGHGGRLMQWPRTKKRQVVLQHHATADRHGFGNHTLLSNASRVRLISKAFGNIEDNKAIYFLFQLLIFPSPYKQNSRPKLRPPWSRSFGSCLCIGTVATHARGPDALSTSLAK